MTLPQERRYSYADILSWNDGARYELCNGQPVLLTSLSDVHQFVSGGLFPQLENYLVGKECTAYSAPFDVRLFEEADG